MFKDKQIRDAIENTIMLIVFILAIVFLLNVIFFDIINICPKNGISVSCKADTSEVYPDEGDRKYKKEFIWGEADIRYYSCLDVDKILQASEDQASKDQVISILKNEIIERAGAVWQDDNEEGFKEQLNSYEYYNYRLLKDYEEKTK